MAITNPAINGAIGDVGSFGSTTTDSFAKFEAIMSTVVGLLTIGAGLWFVVQLLLGAIHWISAGGDKQAVSNARGQITHAIVGLAIVAGSYVLVIMVGYIFGVELVNVAATLRSLRRF
ncbi:hypothetical protein A2634_02985 [Candidatus Amesbacteria bacterium RIFCSPHIGHO2_01_FULL_48_32]|uniref:Uncharacterized protein n=1 Tax=Candidatus Amesbacteria bacterium RIFCSPLOWO2_01_FULL_48_25 TaxID=1797259 RepID=A0A1F4ZB27_9BACT|nr:MAG: hypothetical protein A2634_02985 [Candidatus Amesbacteria bacterium RIFCSPHIGHO2_01_FULL_48_32]OGD03106.1 MAG: hypothetical protein A2989_02205 [Candidatus Amesbacteria bacterium RIFCSPLOWO2_01_FULL_48_25]